MLQNAFALLVQKDYAAVQNNESARSGLADETGIVVIGNGDSDLGTDFGQRAQRLNQLAKWKFPVPPTVAVAAAEVERIVSGAPKGLEIVLAHFPSSQLLAVRPSPNRSGWGSIKARFNIGMSPATQASLARQVGDECATSRYADFIHSFAVDIGAISPQVVTEIEERHSASQKDRVSALLDLYEQETGNPFPQCPFRQLEAVFIATFHAWKSPERAALRDADMANGGENRLGLIVQSMIAGAGQEGTAFGTISSIVRETGESQESGQLRVMHRQKWHYQGGCNLIHTHLSEQAPQVTKMLSSLRLHLRDVQEIEFAYDGMKLWLLDSVPAERNVSAAIRVAVDLANDGVISRQEALSRVAPTSLNTVLHPQIASGSDNAVIARGIPASPGAATGMIAFSSRTAERFAAAGNACILVRAETGPDDFRGIHMAQAVLTGRGGLTSHAAVVARGLGVPCVVGATDIQIVHTDNSATDPPVLKAAMGVELREGDSITLDGTQGTVLEGRACLVEPTLNNYFETFLSWADDIRDMGVRANADIIDEVRVAKTFRADGIGLCRTEHMYFEKSQLTIMRRMLFSETPEERRIVLRQLIEMQKCDFIEIFREMAGRAVCIRLFDPPLHEFVPRAVQEFERMAEELNCDVKYVIQRTDELKEFNPMLGMRGVRVGIVMPEIYQMQARAIFEAAVEVHSEGLEMVPEIMIPLVSANREVELVRNCVDHEAKSVMEETGIHFCYRLGVMVETPRAALRSGDLATNSDFLSFGTNDLTQMTYGLSRDDSQKFMETYIAQGVYPNDPFGTLDKEGVGELLQIAVQRAQASGRNLPLSICGEHGGDPQSISFCRALGFDSVSCSPYRVPIARLAAAQAVIVATDKAKDPDNQ